MTLHDTSSANKRNPSRTNVKIKILLTGFDAMFYERKNSWDNNLYYQPLFQKGGLAPLRPKRSQAREWHNRTYFIKKTNALPIKA